VLEGEHRAIDERGHEARIDLERASERRQRVVARAGRLLHQRERAEQARAARRGVEPGTDVVERAVELPGVQPQRCAQEAARRELGLHVEQVVEVGKRAVRIPALRPQVGAVAVELGQRSGYPTARS
jgi:hypothetical protein